MPAHLLQDRGTPQRFARPRPTLLDFESYSQEAAGKSSKRNIPTWQAYLFICFSPVIADCYLLAGSDGSGTWLACLFVWWVCTGKRWEMLQPQLPWVAIAPYPTLFLHGELPHGTGHFLVPQRSSERCHPCRALPGSVGTGGTHRDPRSVRTVLFQPGCLHSMWPKRTCSWLFSENVRRAIWWRIGVFATQTAVTFPRLPRTMDDNGLWADRAKNWEIWILWAFCWLCLTGPKESSSFSRFMVGYFSTCTPRSGTQPHLLL